MIKGSKAIKAAPSGAASEARRAVWIVRLWPFLLAQRRKLAITLAATLVAQVASVSLPLIQKIIVDDVIVAGLGSLVFWLVLFVTMATVTAVGTIIRRASGNSLGFGLQHDLREAVYRHVQRLDVGYRTDAEGGLLSSGEVISRSTADIALIQTLFSQLHVLAGSLITFVGSLAIMLVLSPGLGLVALVTLPLIAVFALLMRQRIYPAVWADQRAHAELAGIVSETTTGVKVIRAFGQQQREFDRYVGAAARLFGSRLRTAGINALYTPAMQAVPVIGQVGVLSIGALLAWNGAITVGTFLAFFAYLIQLAQPVRTLTNALSTVQQARAGTNRVFELLDTFPEVVEASNAPALNVTQGNIALRNLTFAHRDGQHLLDGLDLDIHGGETLAVVGGSGSGKSTLALMLARFYDPQHGEVRIDGQNVRGVTLNSLRRAVGMVFEDAMLFTGTIQENIARGRVDTTPDSIRHAARIAGADTFISELPLGYATPVAELGASLSGGQRQRLALARALLIDPPILVLDDATSAVDVRTEAGILDALRTVLQGRTTLIVARRQSTLALADRVALIADGRVAAIGTHDELLASNADYRALVSTEIADDLSPEPAAVESEGDGIDLAAWPETAAVAGSAEPIAFTESVSAGGHSRSAIPANAALAAGRDDISAALARLPVPDANPGVDVAREINAREPFSLGRFLAPYRNGLLIGLLLVIVEAVLGVLVPLIIGRGIDAVVARSGSDVLIAALSLLGVGVAAWCNGMLLLRHTARTAERLLFALRIRILAQFHRLPLERYEAEESGQLMARATTDVESLATLFQQGLLNAVVGLATCAGILVGLTLLEPRLALVLLPVLPILILATEWYRRASAKAYEQSRKHVAAVYASIQEGVTAGRATRALVGESVAAEAFGKRSSAYKRARERASRISAIYFPSLQMLSSISKALVLLVGSGFVASGQMAVGVLVTFLLYVEQFFAPIQQLSQVFDQWMQAGTALRRIADLLGEPVPRARQTDDASSTVLGPGTLTLADVSFSYPGTEARALSHIDIDIAPGTKLAVVGTTGAGKSTLARLVTGLTPPSAGTIALDGRDIATIPGPVLHRAIAYVPQEPMLFGRSVADNIAYGRPDATPAQIEAAARAVGAHAFIVGLPHGYRSVLAESGRSLAAGQRQLLCLARALLVEPRILVLDEATSRLDLAVEAAIERVLAADQARTSIIIAHRLQTVCHADIVVVLEAGEIVEIGKPADLLVSKGWFARLHGFATPSAQSQSDISAAESAPAGIHAS